MRPLSGNPEGLPLAAGTVLETAARTMTGAHVNTAHVVDTDGRPIGAIDLQTIIAAMVTPTSHTDRQAA